MEKREGQREIREGQMVKIIAGDYGVGQTAKVVNVQGDAVGVMFNKNLGLWFDASQVEVI